MSYEAWHRGYQEVKNVMHNEIGITKEEILDVFRQAAKDEIQNILSEKRSFIYETIKTVIKEEMILAIQDEKFPRIRKNIWDYTNGNQYKDYITDIMKEEILDVLRSQFELNFDITKK